MEKYTSWNYEEKIKTLGRCLPRENKHQEPHIHRCPFLERGLKRHNMQQIARKKLL